jgi:hypothetical protein
MDEELRALLSEMLIKITDGGATGETTHNANSGAH